MRKKGELLIENIIFIVLNLVFLTILVLFILRQGNGVILIEEAYALHNWNPSSKLETLGGANHVFGAHHPWEKESISTHLEEVVEKIIIFLKG